MIYAYGPIALFEATMRAFGARDGEPAKLGAHVHHYHPEWDEAERRVLLAFQWERSPLRPSDVQFDPARDIGNR